MKPVAEYQKRAGDAGGHPAQGRAGENIRKILHDLSQPMMVIQGYLELFELGKCSSDADTMKKVLASVSAQMAVLQEIYGRLRAAVSPMASGDLET